MESPHHHQDDDHCASRRVRELYRYFQPELPPQPTPAPSVSSYFDSWVSDAASWNEEASVPAISTDSVSTPIPTPSVNTAASTSAGVSQQEEGEGLVLGNPSRTLNAFAQLAALRLDVQRVLIRWVFIDLHLILHEANLTSVSRIANSSLLLPNPLKQAIPMLRLPNKVISPTMASGSGVQLSAMHGACAR